MIPLSEIEAYFEANRPSEGSVSLQKGVTIIDKEKFIESAIITLKANPGNKTFLPYYKRLLALYEYERNLDKH